MELRGRWALVTGSGKRVGRAIALELGARGTNVVVHYRQSAREAEETAAEIRRHGVEAVTARADLADAAAVAALAAECARDGRRIDVLVNSASNYLRAPLDDVTEAHWDASLDVNLKAPFLLSWHLGRAMRDRGEGCIVNLVDWAAERPYADHLAYCVSKAGLVCLTRALAKALAPAVRVNAVAPGPVLLPDDFTGAQGDAARRATVLKRIGTAEDVARCVRFVVEEAEYSTGATFSVDGGRAIA
jgi:NAD(P)-dependent dehydrogenase (short-subunit alcohol dehydrogenase family)